MNEQQTTGQQGPRCVCEEVMGHIQDAFGVSENVRTHLKNSRIEFLKAIRTVIDERIERMQKATNQGTKIAVE
jgi:hypothetical protein